MPIVRTKWEDISVDERRNYQDEESFNMFWDEIDAEAAEVKQSGTQEQFEEWLAATGNRWVD